MILLILLLMLLIWSLWYYKKYIKIEEYRLHMGIRPIKSIPILLSLGLVLYIIAKVNLINISGTSILVIFSLIIPVLMGISENIITDKGIASSSMYGGLIYYIHWEDIYMWDIRNNTLNIYGYKDNTYKFYLSYKNRGDIETVLKTKELGESEEVRVNR